jgi:hypothetical protein
MTKVTWIALLTEVGLSRWEAEGLWTAQTKVYPENVAHLKAADVLELGREMLPALQRLRDLQRARGASHRPDL